MFAKYFIKISIFKIFIISLLSLFILSCGFYEPVDQRQRPDTAAAKARKNVEEGKGMSLGGLLGKGRGGSFEFSSSNPMWKATLETLDFLPMSTVDYSGGIIITDWYADNQNSNKSIKITIRFLSNQVTANSLKIVVHEKSCSNSSNCITKVISDSKIKDELNAVILRKAAIFDRENKKKKN